MSQIWQRLLKIAGRFSSPTTSDVRIDGAAIATPKEVADYLSHAFAVVFSDQTESATFTSHRDRIEAQPLDFSDFRDVANLELSLDLDFRIKEIIEISLRQCGKTSGPDDIIYEMLRE